MSSHDPKVVVALDFANQKDAMSFIDRISPTECKLKVGKEMFTHFGPTFVRDLINRNFDVFLDLKFHDIPNTTAKAVQAAADLGVWMVNVHASGGTNMMSAARNALTSYGADAPLLIGVTVLTSTSEADFVELGLQRSLAEHVQHLASLAKQAGLDGVVCSAQEAVHLKQQLGNEFKLVTPGIRPSWAATDDQQRIVTPEQAVTDGVDYLVIGRPITKAENPHEALKRINSAINFI